VKQLNVRQELTDLSRVHTTLTKLSSDYVICKIVCELGGSGPFIHTQNLHPQHAELVICFVTINKHLFATVKQSQLPNLRPITALKDLVSGCIHKCFSIILSWSLPIGS